MLSTRLPSHLRRNRHGVFYFRRAVPLDLRRYFATRELYRSLGTARRSEAVRFVRIVSARVEAAFALLRGGVPEEEKELLQADLIMRIDLGELGMKLEVEHEPHETEQAKELIGHAIDRIGPLVSAPRQLAPAKKPGPLLSDLVGRYIAEVERAGRRAQTVIDYKGDLGQLLKIIGDIPVTDLDHERINECKEKLLRLPANVNKAPQLRDRGIDDILALGLPPQSPTTARKKWQRLEAFLGWVVKHGYLGINYAAGKKPKAKPSSYEKFTPDDLKRLFGSPLYRDAAYDEAFKYWLPVLALFTGARLEELAQLHVADVRKDKETGIWCLDITEEVDDEDGAADGKQLKNHNSVRTCPLHPRLLELGLVDYVNGLRASGYDRLFPELTRDTYGKFGPRASEWFTEYRRGCGVGEVVGKSRKGYHSFRHTAIAALQKAGVAQELREAIAGHASQAVNVRVYSGVPPLARLAAEIGKLAFDVAIPSFAASPAHEEARRRAATRGRARAPARSKS